MFDVIKEIINANTGNLIVNNITEDMETCYINAMVSYRNLLKSNSMLIIDQVLNKQLSNIGFTGEPWTDDICNYLMEKFSTYILITPIGDTKDYPKWTFEIINLKDYKSPIENSKRLSETEYVNIPKWDNHQTALIQAIKYIVCTE